MWGEKNWELLLRRSGWSLVVGIHTEAAVAPHSWALEQRKGRGGEWETTLVFKGSQQARSEGRAGRWCTPLSPFDGFFMFNLWWHPAGHQDHSKPSSSPHWHVCSWISGQTMVFWASTRGRRRRGGQETDHLPQFSHRSAGEPFPTAEGCLGWRRCARWGRCWAAGFSGAPRGHETALWCSWWFLHLEKDQIIGNI